MSTPTAVNSTQDLSGGTGITAAALVLRTLRRLNDNPFIDTFQGTGAGNSITTGDTTFTVPTDATTKYQQGMYIDFVEDGSFERVRITGVPSATTITVLRGDYGTTAATHAANARGALMLRYQPLMVSEVLSDIVDSLWPELFDVAHVDWNISTSAQPELWYVLPTDCERVIEMYQRTLSTPTDIRVPNGWMGPTWIDSNFLDGGAGTDVRGLQVYGVANNTSDSKLHGIYLRRISLTTLTNNQIAILLYMAGAIIMETAMAGESKPDRRAGLQQNADLSTARNVWFQQAEILKRKEQERLMEYVPRRNRVKFRGGRHYSDQSFTLWHPVRPY